MSRRLAVDGLESAQVMTTKDERIGIRVPSETKHLLLQIAREEGRSLAASLGRTK
jgi:hypothetical protein